MLASVPPDDADRMPYLKMTPQHFKQLRTGLRVNARGHCAALRLHQACRLLGGKALRAWKLLEHLHWHLRQTVEASLGWNSLALPLLRSLSRACRVH